MIRIIINLIIFCFISSMAFSQDEEEDINILMAINAKDKEVKSLCKEAAAQKKDIAWCKEFEKIGKEAWENKDYLDILFLYRVVIAGLKQDLPKYKDRDELIDLTLTTIQKIKSDIEEFNKNRIKTKYDVWAMQFCTELLKGGYIKESASIALELEKILKAKDDIFKEYKIKNDKLKKLASEARIKDSKKKEFESIQDRLRKYESEEAIDLYQTNKMIDKALSLFDSTYIPKSESKIELIPEEKDTNNLYKNPLYKFRVSKPPYKTWKFSRIDDGSQGHMTLKIEHISELAGVEIRVHHSVDVNIKNVVDYIRADTKVALTDYQLISEKKVKFKGKASYNDVFTGFYKDKDKKEEEGKKVYFERYIFNRSDFFYCITMWSLYSQQRDFKNRLYEIIGSFEFE